MVKRIERFGWIPDLPDQRDLLYSAPPAALSTLPPRVDLRPNCPPVYDQGELGSCTANAIGGLFEYVQRQEGVEDFVPSRLFLYYQERVLEHSISQDNGAQLRDGMKAIHKQGICHEMLWPYKISQFAHKPSTAAYKDALKHISITYSRLVQNLTALRTCLAGGHPFVFGFSVYESFESDEVAKTGIVNLPAL